MWHKIHRTIVCSLLIGLLHYAPLATAHPHSYIDLQAKFIVGQNQLTGIEFHWTLDEISSLSLTYDILQQMPYEHAMSHIAQELMENIHKQDFFTQILLGKQSLTFHLQPNSAQAKQQKLRTVFRFILDLDQPITLQHSHITLSTFEPTYYVDMSYLDESDISSSKLPPDCKIALIKPNYDSYWSNYANSLDQNDTPEENTKLGAIFAQKVTLICK